MKAKKIILGLAAVAAVAGLVTYGAMHKTLIAAEPKTTTYEIKSDTKAVATNGNEKFNVTIDSGYTFVEDDGVLYVYGTNSDGDISDIAEVEIGTQANFDALKEKLTAVDMSEDESTGDNTAMTYSKIKILENSITYYGFTTSKRSATEDELEGADLTDEEKTHAVSVGIGSYYVKCDMRDDAMISVKTYLGKAATLSIMNSINVTKAE